MGIFVTFEGIEGCGKSTQISRLADYLSAINHPFLLTREPGGTKIGQNIRTILLGTENIDLTSTAELFLYAADRAQHIRSVIMPALAEGKTVLCDRFTDATRAYQGGGRKLDSDLISTLNSIATEGIGPDLTFLIDCPVETGLARAIKRSDSEGTEEMRFENEDIAFHERVRKAYLEIAEAEAERVIVIDGSESVEEVHNNICSRFLKRLKKIN